ncbi:MAG: hypothetical protein RBU23_05575 [Candidatus Auribacterota bacterium]|jgi:hypothetical protein|nr:hypothetical protein [Candidatus Auribacterota bacterium]
MDTISKKIGFLVLIMCIYAVYPSQGALYSPEQQKLVISRLNSVIAYQQQYFKTLSAEIRSIMSCHAIDNEMMSSSSNQGAILAKVIDNFFILKLFPKVQEFLIVEFNRKDIGKPFVSYVKLNEPFTVEVVSEDPKKDSHLDSKGSDSKVLKVFESGELIQHFDQQFHSYIYRIAYGRGLMVKRGKYLFVDSDLNGVPESLYFLSKYVDARRRIHNCAKLIASGENVIKNTAYHERYLDTLFLVMDYLMNNFPFEQFEVHEDYAQAL